MKITLHQTPESLDPNAITSNPESSLKAYIKEVSSAILHSFPEAEIVIEKQEGGRSWKLTGLNDDQESRRDGIEQEIQEIIETVFAVGNFWE